MIQRNSEADALAGEDPDQATEPRLRPVTAGPVSPLRPEPEAQAAPAGQAAKSDNAQLPQDFVLEEGSIEELLPRLARLERRARVQTVALVLAVLAAGYFAFVNLVVEDVIVRQTLMESKEITLLDNDGAARLFIRMYSKVPVLQIMDSNGKPRMSMGLRFDDTPFIDLSDKSGRTRATFEMTENDTPALRLFDDNGNRTFNIN